MLLFRYALKIEGCIYFHNHMVFRAWSHPAKIPIYEKKMEETFRFLRSGVLLQAFNPSTWMAESGVSLNSRSAGYIESSRRAKVRH